MPLSTIFEIIGYVGSALVIISMLMTSVIKLRIINTVGSVIFCAYALCIHSYPTAAMQVCLIIINAVNLYKLLAVKKEYSILKVNSDDSYLKFFLESYKKDIKKFFPEEIILDKAQTIFLVCCDSCPAGVFIAQTNSDTHLHAVIDYTTPKYRDGSAGKFLYEYLAAQGFKEVQALTSCSAHKTYLKKMGFKQEDGIYKKEL